MPAVKSSGAAPASKLQRYRHAQARRGMKLIRVWVPDPNRPEFSEEAARQAAVLRGRAEEQDALNFIAHAFEWPPE
ncbi:antitoxin MazE-like protein [Oryzibacter oryziterrae]|uniref:antitoxin MazE-like protein n=1 Tax=Oryzibacter oryziterrae TaxID=2766474 RepID=UPI002104F119|nr:antitoxin MazE-like protein [Oryzibacter oryziterrae]